MHGTLGKMTINDWNILHIPRPCFIAPYSNIKYMWWYLMVRRVAAVRKVRGSTATKSLKFNFLATLKWGRYKSALIAALVFYCGCRSRRQSAAIDERIRLLPRSRSSIAVLLYWGAAVKTDKIKKTFFYCVFSIAAAAAAGRSGCWSTPNLLPK